jgi:hypothetical protein
MRLAVRFGLAVGCFAAIIANAVPTRATAAEYFAAPRGREAGSGTRFDPWDLRTALSEKSPLGPGDTLWLLGGVYRGQFTSRLQGSAGRPITIRPASGQRAIIDCRAEGKSNWDFMIHGAWCEFRDFEVTCSDRRRQTQSAGSAPGDIHRGGISCRGSHIKLINLVIHDVSSGIGFWSQGEGGEIYGCLIFNNGWMGPDRGHGHGIYAQSHLGTKIISDNVVFNQFGGGIHCYGSSRAALNNIHLEGNICFNNGCQVAVERRTRGILCGGGCPVRGARVVENVVYSDRFSRALELGFYDARASNVDADVRDNYLVGSTHIINFEKVTFTGNTLVGHAPFVELRLEDDEDTSDYEWNHNQYFTAESGARAFTRIQGTETRHRDFDWWQENTGFDLDGVNHDQHAGCEVRVRPNKYQPGRAHVAVINWDNKQEVDVDLSDVLPPEQAFRVVSAQDFFGEPIIRSTYRGGSVRFPLRPVPPQPALAWEDHPLPVTEPQFAVFVVLPE